MQLMRLADGALYQAKEAGRNSVRTAPAVEQEDGGEVERPTPIARRRVAGEGRAEQA
jgi:hypothetical protein